MNVNMKLTMVSNKEQKKMVLLLSLLLYDQENMFQMF